MTPLSRIPHYPSQSLPKTNHEAQTASNVPKRLGCGKITKKYLDKFFLIFVRAQSLEDLHGLETRRWAV